MCVSVVLNFHRELSDTIMNFVGAFMWVAVGGTALHYWNGYLADHDFLHVASERQVMFSIKIVNGLSAILSLYFLCVIGWFGTGFSVCNIWCIVCG